MVNMNTSKFFILLWLSTFFSFIHSLEPLPEAFNPIKMNENLIIYELVSAAANQNWKMEIFDLSEPVSAHYHKEQRQILVVLEGELEAFLDDQRPIHLERFETLHIPAGLVHALRPVGKSVRFLAIDSPNFVYPEDVFFDKQLAQMCSSCQDKVYDSKEDLCEASEDLLHI